MAALQPSQVYQLLISAGASPIEAAALTSIAGRESGFNPQAFNGNAGTGDRSYGLFQINLLNGGWTGFLQQHGMKDPATALLTPQGAAQAAVWIFNSSGLNPWGGYKGQSWSTGTNLSVGAAASGGAVSVQQLQGFQPSGSPAQGGGQVTAGGANAAASPSSTKFNVPKGGTLYAVNGTYIVVYKVGSDNVYYDFSEPGIGSRANMNGLPFGGVLTSQQLAQMPNLVHAGVASELAGKDIQASPTYQGWLGQLIDMVTGGNKEMANDPGVVSLIVQGAANHWSTDEIDAKLKGTQYFKTHDDAQRQWQTLSPAEQQQRTNAARAQLQDAWYAATGEQINPADATLNKNAMALASGATDITQLTWQWIRPEAAKNPQSPWSRQQEQEQEAQRQQGVDISNMTTHVQDLFNQYGIKPSDDTVSKMADDLVTKKTSDAEITNKLIAQASVLYPWAKDQLADGRMTVKDVAQPWVDTMNRVMETSTDLFNPQVQKALTRGQPVYDFEKQLKQSDAWLSTTNARQDLVSAASQVGQKMGFTK